MYIEKGCRLGEYSRNIGTSNSTHTTDNSRDYEAIQIQNMWPDMRSLLS
jgi:hypothetical protein